MPRYIDGAALLKKYNSGNMTTYEMYQALVEQPTADVVNVVRCKDCKHCEHINDEFSKDWYQCKRRGNFAQQKPYDFCSYGERKSSKGECEK